MVNPITIPNSNTLFFVVVVVFKLKFFFGSLILKESGYIRLSNSNKMRVIKYFIYNLKEGNTNNMQMLNFNFFEVFNMN